LVILGFGCGDGVGAAGEIATVSPVFRPDA
jgi:hypothetical protein